MIDFSPYKERFDIIGKDKSNVVLVHNFINPQDLIKINEYLDTKKDDDEFIGGKDLRFEVVNLENPELGQIILKYQQKIYEVLTEAFIKRYGISVVKRPINAIHFVKWKPGMSSLLHSDCETPEGTPAQVGDFYRYNISVLAYPNDNYEGGEITFPEYNIIVKPKAGDLIMFPGNSNYRHTVETITSGTRYTMPSWYTFDIGQGRVEPTPSSYLDSAQLWPDSPNIDLVGDKTRDSYERLRGLNSE